MSLAFPSESRLHCFGEQYADHVRSGALLRVGQPVDLDQARVGESHRDLSPRLPFPDHKPDRIPLSLTGRRPFHRTHAFRVMQRYPLGCIGMHHNDAYGVVRWVIACCPVSPRISSANNAGSNRFAEST